MDATVRPENCRLVDGVAECTLSFKAANWIPVKVTLLPVFARVGGGVSATFEHPVVPCPNVVPYSLYTQYSIPPNSQVTNPKSSQCVVEFEQQYYSDSDLQLFFNQMGILSAPVTVIGPNDMNNAGAEANLDIQWIMAMAPGSYILSLEPISRWFLEHSTTMLVV